MSAIGRVLLLLVTGLGVSACGGALVEPIAEIRQGSLETFVSSADATLHEGAPQQGARTECRARGNARKAGLACLLRWTLPEANVTVESAWLELHVINASPLSFDVFPVLQNWSEADATWVERAANIPWQTPGARGPADRGPRLGELKSRGLDATFVFDAAGLALVQSWFDDPSTHRGIVIASDENDNGIGIASREHPIVAHRPKLVVRTGG